MSVLTSLLILIVVARLLGQIFKRLNQSAIVGEMLAGVILGPSLLDFIRPNVALNGITELAVFLVVLSAGLEMNFKDIEDVLKKKTGIIVAALGFIIPLTAGILLGVVYSLDAMRTIFLGLCVSITALPVAVRILESFKLLHTDIARLSIATAVINDVLALLGIVIVFVLVFGSISDALGFHFVIGAFFGALLIDKKFFLASRYEELERVLASVTGGFLAPVFFATLGLEFKWAEMGSSGFVIAVLIVSIVSKIAAGWLGGRLAGMPQHEALGLGIILNGRGVMELVVASIALQRGFIGHGLFSTLVLMGVVTTILTPLLFRRFVSPQSGAA